MCEAVADDVYEDSSEAEEEEEDDELHFSSDGVGRSTLCRICLDSSGRFTGGQRSRLDQHVTSASKLPDSEC